ncbi:TPA: TIR domain-containing protein, partial [Streptococcus suis]
GDDQMARSENKYRYVDEHILKAHFKIDDNGVKIMSNEGSQSDFVRLTIDHQVVDVFKRKKDGVSIRIQQDTDGKLQAFLRRLDQRIATNPVTVFVVYGHGDGGVERKELRDILETWNFKPIFLDQKPNEGNTIIEKLEEYMDTAKAGIVLATPDDIGFANNDHGRANQMYRPRQNVVLETGMVISRLGRDNMIILSRDDEERPMELPGDLSGIVRVPFQKDVSETKSGLMRDLVRYYDVDSDVEDSAE